MGRTNQGGSILSYIIIGGVLVLLLIGGVYFIRQQTNQAGRGDQPSQTADQPQPSTEPVPQDTPKKDAPSGQQSTPPAGHAPTVAELPQTGPVETFATIAALGSLTWVVAAYVQSRRQLASL